MSNPVIADNKPKKVSLKKGEEYAFCVCGRSSNQPFCDGSHGDTGFKPKVFKAEKDEEAVLCQCKQTGSAPYCDGTHQQFSDDQVGKEAPDSDDDGDDESDAATVGEAISASGNPFLEPLQSWNADVSLEWYAADTTSLAVAAYYKSLQTGFETDLSTISLVVDGTPTPVQIARTINSDDKSRIFGFEINAQHQFDFGLGFQVSYNFADSNFEFPDPTIGRSGESLAVFIEDANLPGYSKHTANATVFYETGPFNVRLAYKWRSDYFKPFRTTSNRFAAEQGFLDFSTSYDITRNVEIRFQVLNILDEPNLMYRPTRDSLAQSDFSGRRYFLGLRGRF